MATAANPFDINTTGGKLTPGTTTTAAQFDPVQRQVDAAKETTSGQLQGILAQDSPLMQQARAQAKQGMAARGLINSSMAQGAGVAAMLERATPIAAADAGTYANQALTNQQAVNTGGQFNVGQQNTFGLQKGAQAFALTEREAGQSFTAGQAGLEREQQSKLQTAQQTFAGAQSNLDRAQQLVLTDKSIGAQEALQKAQQDFAAAQSGLDRAQQTSLQTGAQTFTASQNKAQQDLTVAQAALDRAQQLVVTDKSIEAQSALQTAQQNFASAQSALDRTQQTSLQTGAQTFTASQNKVQQDFTAAQEALNRAQQIALSDKSIEAQAALQTAQQNFAGAQSALDRSQQTALQTGQQTFTAGQAALDRTQQTTVLQAQQDFTSAQSALDRAQQVSLTDKSITAQANLQTAQQNFQAAQGVLEREQQTALQNDQQAAALEQIGFKAKVDLQNIPTAFAANISNTTMNGVNAIMADGAMNAEAKKGAIANLIKYANAQVDWANKFYSAAIPAITAPA
jgi:hypothetical protein